MPGASNLRGRWRWPFAFPERGGRGGRWKGIRRRREDGTPAWRCRLWRSSSIVSGTGGMLCCESAIAACENADCRHMMTGQIAPTQEEVWCRLTMWPRYMQNAASTPLTVERLANVDDSDEVVAPVRWCKVNVPRSPLITLRLPRSFRPGLSPA